MDGHNCLPNEHSKDWKKLIAAWESVYNLQTLCKSESVCKLYFDGQLCRFIAVCGEGYSSYSLLQSNLQI